MQSFVKLCKTLQNFATLCKTVAKLLQTQKFCKVLQSFAKLCKTLQNFCVCNSFATVLQSVAKFCKVLQSFTKLCKTFAFLIVFVYGFKSTPVQQNYHLRSQFWLVSCQFPLVLCQLRPVPCLTPASSLAVSKGCGTTAPRLQLPYNRSNSMPLL